MAGAGSLNTHFAQYQQHHTHKAVEGKAHLRFPRDIRQHEVVAVGIDAPSPTLAAEQADAVRLTIIPVDFVFHYLVAPIDDAGLHLPHEESIVLQLQTSHLFLHGEEEREFSDIVFTR